MMIRYLVACLAAISVFGGAADNLVFKPGEETTVEWKVLPTAIKVYLPSDYSPDRKHPCIFYYHGTNGIPETRTMRYLTNGKTYVVVGMEYHVRGKISLPAKELEEYHANNMTTYKSVRKWLESRVSIDPKRVYMGGASKGGWITSFQGEKDMANLAGLIILMGGRQWSQEPIKNTKAFKDKSIFVGVGAEDPNDLASHWARVCYSKLGANVLLEEYPNLGHNLSFDSGLLQDWLAMEGPLKDATDADKAAIDAWVKKRQEKIEGTADLGKRYFALDLLRVNPKLAYASTDTRKSLRTLWKTVTAKGTPGYKEMAAKKEFRIQVAKEYKWWGDQNKRPITKTQYKKNYRTIKAIDKAYKTILADYPKTRYAKRAKLMSDRLVTSIANMTETMKTIDSAKTTAQPPGGILSVGRER